MKDLERLAHRAMEELDAIGVPYAPIDRFEVNTRAVRRWGQCRRRNGAYIIDINVELLDDNVSDESVLDTLIHELIHTCPNCMNHGSEWKKWAELVNDCYACYNISRCSSAYEKGINVDKHMARVKTKQSTYKWVIECDDCNTQWKYKRKPSRFTIDHNNELQHCSCPYCKNSHLFLRPYN